jgi:hypothetical protein
MWNEKIRRVGRQITRPGLTAILWLVVIAGFALGIASLLVKELHGATGAAATMLAASIAGLVALRLNETVEARRLRELRERRQEPYEALVVQLMGSFTAANADESKRRARVAVWGSPELIRLLTEWNTLVTPLADRGPVPIPPELRFKLMQAVAAVALEVRKDTTNDSSTDALDVDSLAAMFFNDFAQARDTHLASEVSGGRPPVQL